MTQAFHTGISGVKTHQSGMNVTADNLANISTVGFRASNTEFASLYEKSLNTHNGLGSVTSTTGSGTRLQATTMQTTQGALMSSERNTDLAIAGSGWFGVQKSGDVHFSRAGDFGFDANGNLVTPDGYGVLGSMGGNIDNGELSEVLDSVPLDGVNAQQKLQFPQTLIYPAEATTEAFFGGNIGKGDEPVKMGANVFDSSGDKNELMLTFTKVDSEDESGMQWQVEAVVSSKDGEVFDTQEGVVSFDETGGLTANTLGALNNNGADLNVNLGDAFSGIVSQTNRSLSSSSSTNGVAQGDLIDYEINRNGEVLALFSNGKQSSVGRVAVFHFANEQGLERAGSARFTQSSNSGDPFFHVDDNGQNYLGSTIMSRTLENSNAKMDVSLTEMIIMQRAFDANSKSITTADQLIQKALQMNA